MSRVEGIDRRDVGHGRPAAGFLSGAAALLGLSRLFSALETGGYHPAPLPDSHPQAATPGIADAASAPRGNGMPDIAQGDEIERLAAHIAAAGRTDRARRVLITHPSSVEAPLAGLDCAAFASQFARSLAHEGRTILVIFGAGGGSRPGLSELIDGSASFSEAIHRESGSRLHILPSGHARAVTGGGLNVVLDALADTYDFVVLSVTDESSDALRRLALTLGPRADHVLIGCPGQTGSPDMIALRDALKDEGAGEVIAARIGLTRAESREAA
ncbi:MAG: lipopolysaccharide biosynthesis protein [Hyphomicrobiales bacterium]|nr:lipopolysaccharide biosynthesis protein [Hyphomicrobiales bacterium]